MTRPFRRYLFFAVLLAVFLAVSAVSAFWGWANTPIFRQGEPMTFEIMPGHTARHVALELERNHIPVSPLLFGLLIRLSGQSAELRAGPYEIRAGDTPRDLLHKITRGVFVMESVTIVEGWTFAQMRQILARHPALRHDTADWPESRLLAALAIPFGKGEGLFYPDTYLFQRGTSDIQIYRLAHDAMMSRLNALWKNRPAALPYRTPYEALTMASIIEKETGHASDRKRVAGVFINRLKIGMKLQTDPTVIYGMGERYRGKIRRIDLQTDTPYNTYTRYGLPPTPIALPGQLALEAAFYPADTDALYFVARGDGTSHFSRDLNEHNEAVDKYIR